MGSIRALLDRSYDPILIAGGSSGSITAALTRALLTNKSIQETEIKGLDHQILSKPQKVSIILGASKPVIDSIIFLPIINEPLELLNSAIRFASTDVSILGGSNHRMAGVEAVTGQVAFAVDFFAQTDFSELLTVPVSTRSRIVRSKMLSELWLRFGDFIELSPEDFILAMFRPNELYEKKYTDGKISKEQLERVLQVKKRYFGLYRSDRPGETTTHLDEYARHREWLQKNHAQLSSIPDEAITAAFRKAVAQVKDVPFISSLSVTLSSRFLMPSPDKVWSAYKGISIVPGKNIKIPEGTLIHTTARTAHWNESGFSEDIGRENFYLVYMASGSLSNQLKRLTEVGQPDLMSYDGGTLFDNEKVLIARPLTLPRALRSSLAEPGAFRRDIVPITQQDLRRQGFTLESSQSLLAFGGWLDSISTNTLQHLDECKDAILSVVLEEKSVSQFQKRALNTAILGDMAIFLEDNHSDDILTPEVRHTFLKRLEERDHLLSDLQAYLDESLDQTPERFRISWDWNNPSLAPGLDDDSKKQVNKAFLDNRMAMMYAAYLGAIEILDGKVVEFPYQNDEEQLCEDIRLARSPAELSKIIHSYTKE